MLMAMRGLSVWVVDDDESVRWVLEQALKQAQMLPRCFESGESFFRAGGVPAVPGGGRF